MTFPVGEKCVQPVFLQQELHMKTLQNETKDVRFKVLNGRRVLDSAVWKWGPLLRNSSQAKRVTRN